MKVPVGGLPVLALGPWATRSWCQPCDTYIRGPKGTSDRLERTQLPALRSQVAKVCIITYRQNKSNYTIKYIPNTCVNTYQIPPVLSCTGIDMYHDVFANGNMQIQIIIHTNTTATFPPLVSKWTRIGMFLCMYLPVLACIWYVLVCIQNLFDTRVFGEHRWYWYVLCTYLHVFWYVLTRILWFCIYSARIGRYWSCWYCLCTYRYHVFPRFAFNAPQAVFAAASSSRFGSQSAGWSEGKTMAHELM